MRSTTAELSSFTATSAQPDLLVWSWPTVWMSSELIPSKCINRLGTERTKCSRPLVLGHILDQARILGQILWTFLPGLCIKHVIVATRVDYKIDRTKKWSYWMLSLYLCLSTPSQFHMNLFKSLNVKFGYSACVVRCKFSIVIGSLIHSSVVETPLIVVLLDSAPASSNSLTINTLRVWRQFFTMSVVKSL